MNKCPVQMLHFVYVLCFGIESVIAKAKPCMYHKGNDQYKKVIPFGSEICYFVVKGATEAVNKRVVVDDLEWFKFDVTAARSVCDKNNATLPIIRNKDQEMFIVNNFVGHDFGPPVTFVFPNIAIGLNTKPLDEGDKYKNITPHYQWDDGTDLQYKPQFKYGWFSHDRLYARIVYNYGKKAVLWYIVSVAGEEEDEPVAVLCSFNYTAGPYTRPTTPSTTTTTTAAAAIVPAPTTISSAAAVYPYAVPLVMIQLRMIVM